MKIRVVTQEGFLFPELCSNKLRHIRDNSKYLIPPYISESSTYFCEYSVCDICIDIKHTVMDNLSVLSHVVVKNQNHELLNYYENFYDAAKMDKWLEDNFLPELYDKLHGNLS